LGRANGPNGVQSYTPATPGTVPTPAAAADALHIVSIREDLPVVSREPVNPVRLEQGLAEIKDPKRLLPHVWRGYPNREILASFANNDINVRTYDGTLYDAFLQAYNNHEDVTLVPDDVWITILFVFTQYVNRQGNAEKL